MLRLHYSAEFSKYLRHFKLLWEKLYLSTFYLSDLAEILTKYLEMSILRAQKISFNFIQRSPFYEHLKLRVRCFKVPFFKCILCMLILMLEWQNWIQMKDNRPNFMMQKEASHYLNWLMSYRHLKLGGKSWFLDAWAIFKWYFSNAFYAY